MNIFETKSQKHFQCNVEETVLSAAHKVNLNLASACESGNCGVCKAKILSGKFKHDIRASALTLSDIKNNFALLCCAYPESDLEIEATTIDKKEVQAVAIPAKVKKKLLLTSEVMKLVLRFPPNYSPSFKSGQFIAIEWHGRKRFFSIANDSRTDGTIDLIIGRIPNGTFTNHVFTDLKTDDLLKIHGPFGEFNLSQHENKTKILVAGGTGIAPFMGMLDHLKKEGADFPIRLYWGNRKTSGFHSLKEIDDFRNTLKDFSFIPVISEADENWKGRSGFVHQAVVEDLSQQKSPEIYVCGNPLMVSAMEESALASGIPENHFFAEKFNHI